jgi:hypothetical protein
MSQLPGDPMSQAGIDEIKALYREAAGEQPPAAHDAAVLAAMHAELASARRARARPLRKWQLPMALAATIVLSVALTLTVEREQPRDDFAPMWSTPTQGPPIVKPRVGNAPLPAEHPPKSLPGENSQGVLQQGIGAAKPAAPVVPDSSQSQEKAFAPPAAPAPAPPAQDVPAANAAPARSQPLGAAGLRRENTDKAQTNSGADADAAPSPQVPTAPPITSPSRDSFDAAKAKTAAPPVEYKSKPVAQPEAPPPPPPAVLKPEASSRAFAQPPAPDPAPSVAVPEAFSRGVETRQRDNNAGTLRAPHAWLEVIRGLKQAGKNEEAGAELKKFRLAYPDYPVPADLAPPAKP